MVYSPTLGRKREDFLVELGAIKGQWETHSVWEGILTLSNSRGNAIATIEYLKIWEDFHRLLKSWNYVISVDPQFCPFSTCLWIHFQYSIVVSWWPIITRITYPFLSHLGDFGWGIIWPLIVTLGSPNFDLGFSFIFRIAHLGIFIFT